MTAAEIRELRKALGMSQFSFAVYMNVSPTTIFKWEKGEKRPHRLTEQILKRLQAKVKRKENKQGESG